MFNTHNNPSRWVYYYPHNTDKETVEKLNVMPKSLIYSKGQSQDLNESTQSGVCTLKHRSLQPYHIQHFHNNQDLYLLLWMIYPLKKDYYGLSLDFIHFAIYL